MGLGGISIWQLLIILAIVALIFGTKRLRNIGGDLGSAIKGFKKGIKDDDSPDDEASSVEDQSGEQHRETVVDTDGEKVKQEK